MKWLENVWKEFKEFAIKGNAIDLAVGVIIGAAFGSIINSLVKDVVMPPISLLTGGLDFSNKFIILRAAKDGSTAFNTSADAVKAGAITWNYGNFITLVINFSIVADATFFVVGWIAKIRRYGVRTSTPKAFTLRAEPETTKVHDMAPIQPD